MTEKNKLDKETMSWWGWRGNKITKDVNQVIDVRDFIGTPGFALLVLAANANTLSAPEIERYLQSKGVGRSLTYLKKRRWMFQPPGTNNSANRDGKDVRAFKIMSDYPELSIRDLVVLLKERGIKREREWVRIHRCDAVLTATAHK
jgi:hypothetical protein